MLTYEIQAANGQTAFTFPFPYLSQSHLSVTVEGVEATWELTNANTITVLTPTVNEDDIVVIGRTTPILEPAATFASPSTLRASEINIAISQLLFNLQEQDAETLSTLQANGANTQWLGQDKPIKDLGAPVDGTDAARLSDIDSAIVASGSMPPFSGSDVGRVLGVNSSGASQWLNPGGGLKTFQVAPDPNEVVFADGGYALEEGPTSESTQWGTVPVIPIVAGQEFAPFFGGTAPTVNVDSLRLESAGLYEIRVELQLRSIPRAGVSTIDSAAVALTSLDGNAAYARRTNIRLGMTGDNGWQGSQTVVLRAIVDSPGLQTLTLRAAKQQPTSIGDVVIDGSARLFVREIR